MNVIAFLILAATSIVSGTQIQSTLLETGKPVARDIAGGETHSYRVTLEAGQAMHVIVNQLGADVIVDLLDVTGTRLAAIDGPTGNAGSESAWLIATTSGSYGVAIRPFANNEKGRYEVRLDLVRAATPEDR